MRIEIKLYSYHDMDLVGLYKTGQVVFPETTRQVLNAYARKEVFRVRLQHVNYKRMAKYPDDSYRKYYHYYVTLNEKTDKDAIALLNKITPGCRNSFIKVILRQYLCGVLLSAYSIDENPRLFREMASRFQGGREYRDIKEEKNRQKKKQNKFIKTEEAQKTGTLQEDISGREDTPKEERQKPDRQTASAEENYTADTAGTTETKKTNELKQNHISNKTEGRYQEKEDTANADTGNATYTKKAGEGQEDKKTKQETSITTNTDRQGNFDAGQDEDDFDDFLDQAIEYI